MACLNYGIQTSLARSYCQTLFNSLWHGPASPWCKISYKTVERIPAGHLSLQHREIHLSPHQELRFLDFCKLLLHSFTLCSDIRGNMRSYLLFFNTLICLENVGDLVMVNCYDDAVFSFFSYTPVDVPYSVFGRGAEKQSYSLFTQETEEHRSQNLFSLFLPVLKHGILVISASRLQHTLHGCSHKMNFLQFRLLQIPVRKQDIFFSF